MKIHKILNNNVVCTIKENNSEMILMGRGLGFQKKVGDTIDESKIEKTFVLETKEVSEKLATLLTEIPVEHLEVTEKIVQLAKTILPGRLSECIYLTLTDHLSFAFTRHKEGIELKNALLWEIKKFYQTEFEIGLRALEIIEKETGIRLSEDEAGSIALHLVNAQQGEPEMQQTVTMTKIVQDILNIVKYHYKMDLDENTFNYSRFVTHLRYFAKRLLQHESSSNEEGFLFEQVKQKYNEAYRCTEKIEEYLRSRHNTHLSKDEKMYVTLHIHRVTKRNQFE
ncbi:BglG family transcription antiterminator LicT [Bacillus cytotoxicus]|uniref:BglG family transcription antiterminator LicT n=1 Tax=Bacillus cereus group sp. BfR-BA-01492 TaxID=2920361 RepID=UPI001F59FF9B|nr:PRD domain-containing protein [Bacillus cereus group sp. BfR-BA-01492]EMA6344545.1 PRD domain-containing protein [Bacillus cytotoxicus]